MNTTQQRTDRQLISAVCRKQRLLNFLKILTVVFYIFIPLAICIGSMNLLDGNSSGVPFLLICGIIGIPVSIFTTKQIDKEEKRLKQLLGNYITRNILAEKIEIETYNPTGHINPNFLKNCAILPNYDCVSGSDYISGYYRGVKITHSDIKLEREHMERDSDGKRHTEYHTVFQGPVITLEMKQEINGYIRIRERKSPRKEKGFFSHVFSGAADLLGIGHDTTIVETENERFNNHYELSTNNDEMSFYVLTPQFMEHLLRADEHARGYTNIEFQNKLVTITINNGRDSFEIQKKLYSKRRLEENRQNFRNELNTILAILDEILTKDQLF